MQYILFDDDISLLPLSTRVYNALKRNKINTVNELIQSKENGKLEDFSYLGKNSISEIELLIQSLYTGTEGYCIADTKDKIARRKAEDAALEMKKVSLSIRGETPISKLQLSTRAANALHKLGVKNAYDLMKLSRETIERLPGVGVQTSGEILRIISDIVENPENIVNETKENEQSIEDAENIEELLAEFGDMPIDEVRLSSQALTDLKCAGIFTVGELLQVTDGEIRHDSHIDNRVCNEIKTMIQRIIREGSGSFLDGDHQEELRLPSWRIALVKDGFDFDLIELLREQYGFSFSRIAKWFNLSRQRIFNILDKRSYKRRSIWTGKPMSDEERTFLMSLVRRRQMEAADGDLQCYCMNDMKGSFVCLFVENKQVKCFFLDDLPEDIRNAVINANMHRYTQHELDGGTDGEIVYSLRKAYFRAKNPVQFRTNAMKRGLTTDAYAQYISGYPYFDDRRTNDEDVIAFLKARMVNGKVYLSSDPQNQWIRALASRNAYSIQDFIELYGFEPALDGSELTPEGARERHIEALKQYIVDGNRVYLPTDSRAYRLLNTYCYQKGLSISAYIESLGFERIYERPKLALDVMEQDMRVRPCEGHFEEKIFARYPLLGSAVFSQDTLDKLNMSARQSIDRALTSPSYKLSLVEEMRIILAMVNHAKSWISEENSEFWKYISLQMGYRDRNSAVERLIRASLQDALKQNGRLFVEDDLGRHFRSTALIHSLSPENL